MKYKGVRWGVLLCVPVLIFGLVITAFAHSGRTDGSGGHRDNKNKSGLGSYHYHCGGYPAHLHVNGYCPYHDKFPTGVTIEAGKTTLAIGEEIEISATVSPKNACDKDVDWSSSNTDVAVVYGGKIIAKGYGTATLTAETFNGKKKSVKVTVKEISAQKVSLSGVPEAPDFFIGESFRLQAMIEPEKVDDPSIVWTSSDPEIATVSQDGLVKLLAAGTVTIQASAVNGVHGTIELDVQEKKVESVDVRPDNLELPVGSVYQLSYTVLPSDATYPNLIWRSKNPEIVSVSENGELKAYGCGEAIVVASAANGVSAQVSVSVIEIRAESVNVTGPNVLIVGEVGQLQTAVVPAVATDLNVELWSENPEILTVDGDGTVVAKSVGKTVVHAVQKDVSTTLAIEVLPIPVEKITLSVNSVGKLQKGDTVRFQAVFSPERADPGSIVWNTDHPEIAVIDENGLLTVKGSGTVTITAKTANGTTASYELQIQKEWSLMVVGVGGAALGAGALVAYRVRTGKRKKQERNPG